MSPSRTLSALRSIRIWTPAPDDSLAWLAHYSEDGTDYYFERAAYDKLLHALHTDIPTLSYKNIKEHTNRLLTDTIKLIAGETLRGQRSIMLGAIPPNDLEALCTQALDNARSANREHTVLMRLFGIEIDVPQVKVASLTIHNPAMSGLFESLRNSKQDDHGFTLQAVEDLSLAAACVAVEVVGDTNYCRAEGKRQALLLADVIATFLPVGKVFDRSQEHIGIEVPNRDRLQIILATVPRRNDDGTVADVNLPSWSAPRRIRHTLLASYWDHLKDSGCESLLEKLLPPATDDKTSVWTRLREAVSWYGVAARSEDPRQCHVSLTTALEALLGSERSGSDERTSWGGIAQNLADACAFMIGANYEARDHLEKLVKEQYRKRSSVVHGGGKVDDSDIRELGELVQRAILARHELARLDKIESEKQFREWLRQQRYTVPSQHDSLVGR